MTALREFLRLVNRRLFSPSAARGWQLAGWIAATLIVAVAVWQRWQIPAIAVADPDSWGYFRPALNLLSGGGFVQHNGRDWLYSALVAGALEVTGSMAGLVRFQQMLGVLAGILLAVTLRLWAQFLPGSAGREAGAAVLGAVAMGIFLWRPDSLAFEVQLRPESVWSFFILLQLLCLLAYCRERWVRHRYGVALCYALAAVPLAYANVLLKPSWGLALLVTIAPVFFGILGPRAGLGLRLLTPVAAVGLSVLTLWLPARMLFVRDEMAATRLPLALFTIHAKWILAHYEQKAQSLRPDSAERHFLDRFLPVFREEFAQTMTQKKITYDRLGYDADYLRYRSPIFDWLNSEGGIAGERLNAFCYASYLETWRSQPLGMADKVWGQFRFFLFPQDDDFYKRGTNLQERYRITLEKLPDDLPGSSDRVAALYAAFREQATQASVRTFKVEPWGPLQKLSLGLAAITPALLLVFLVVLAACLLRPGLSDLRLAGLTALLLYAAPAANALTVSIIHVLDLPRYRLSYAGPFLLALAAVILFNVIALIRIAGIRRRDEVGTIEPRKN
ncbi:MAG: hypothetical protein ACOYMS_01225 [Terrimicrobiaceae bacterium]